MAETTRTGSPVTAADIMTSSPRTCSTFSTVLEAVMLFRDADCGAVPVLEDSKPVGLLTDRDVALAVADYPDLANISVDKIMTRGVVSVDPSADVEAIAAAFANNQVRRLLVVGPTGALVGIIGWADFAPHAPDTRVGQVVSEVVEQS